MAKRKIIIEDYSKVLKENDLKCTATRLDIIDIFSKNCKPISAEYIYRKLKNNIDEATVYRTLTSFEKCGILRRVDLRKDAVHFELNNHHHHHIVCTSCGEIEDFKEKKEIAKLLAEVVHDSLNFKNITEHSLELFGLCKICCKK